jgi:hypothetical protein
MTHERLSIISIHPQKEILDWTQRVNRNIDVKAIPEVLQSANDTVTNH